STHDIPLALDYCDRMWLMCADGSFYDKTPQETISSGVLDKIFKISDLKYDPLRHAFRKVR
ncbi:MAG: ABC transporter ATP-binding protein, partial [Bacteroidales bacterium]|nr:ABC transporter ATP-binding protein [Bacteroidales bacterium]